MDTNQVFVVEIKQMCDTKKQKKKKKRNKIGNVYFVNFPQL